mmetsp:Transcript_12915/g.39424  ORF Transcript_12915/g.39424 Transcript_12915/m.39424 type:complete len:105 (+) Transcript_12915:1363-1677(+)
MYCADETTGLWLVRLPGGTRRTGLSAVKAVRTRQVAADAHAGAFGAISSADHARPVRFALEREPGRRRLPLLLARKSVLGAPGVLGAEPRAEVEVEREAGCRQM